MTSLSILESLMLSNMQTSSFFLLPLLLLQTLHYVSGFNATAIKADVGVILDLQTNLGKIFKTCISMAIEDFYSKNSYNTMIVPHFRDSRSDIFTAASAAIDLIKNTQVMANFGPQRSAQASFVIEIGDKVRVPIISPATSPSLSPQESPYFIRSSWCSASQAKVVAAVVKNFGWRDIVLVYEDNNYGSGLLPFLTENLLESNALVSNMTAVSPSAENDQIVRHLHKLKAMQSRVFVVHMLPHLASRFFKMARSAGMMNEGYAWIITDTLTTLLDYVDLESIEAMQGVVGVKAYIPSSSEVRNFTRRWKKRFYKDNPEMERTEVNAFGLWAYDSIAALAEAVERVGVMIPNFKKKAKRGNVMDLEAIETSKTGPSLVRLLRNLSSKGLSGDFKISNGELQPLVFEVMNVIGRGANRVGFWREYYGISKSLMGNDSTRNLGVVVWPGQTSDAPKGWEATANARKLRVGVPIKCRARELVNVGRDEETNEVKVSGFCIDVFEKAMSSLPYKVQFEYIPFQNANQNISGYHYDALIEQVFLKKFDAVVADVTITADRSEMVDFTISYIDSGISTVVPIVNITENDWKFMDPLTPRRWLTAGAFFIFTGFVVWAIEHRVNEEFRGPPHKQVGMIFWFSFSTLVFAHREKVKSNLSRLVVIIWLFVVLVITSSYTAKLTSTITVQQLNTTTTTKVESVGFMEDSLSAAVRSKSDNSTYKVYNSYEEYDEALSKGNRGGGVDAIVDNLPSIRLFLSKYCHKYTMTGRSIHSNAGFGFAFERGSPLAPDVSRAILELKENGNMDEISRNWFGEERGCGSRNVTAAVDERLTVKNFKGLFLVSGLSSLLALAIFLVIFLYKNRRVLTSEASLKQKMCQLAEAFDQERESLSKESTKVCDQRVSADKSKELSSIPSCYAIVSHYPQT